MKLSTLTTLSDADVAQIHRATLDILENCGLRIDSPRMLRFLESKGLTVIPETRTVCFSRTCVEDSLASIPPKFEVHDRGGKFVFALGGGVSRIAAGHNAVFWHDSETGETRPSTVADVEQFARICERLECIDMIGIPVMPQDVSDPKASLLHGVRAVVANSRKPIYFSTDSASVNRAILRMLQAIFEGNMKQQTYGIAQLSPTSPLFWESSVLDALEETVAASVPVAILPEPNAGVSAPYTLAGLLTVNNVECLSGLVMAQLLRPGARVMYANSWTTTDMRTGAALVGSTETTICRIAGAQLARYYRVPSHTTAPNSDNHAHDEQNAWEKTYSLFCAVAARHDLIVNCGMFATGLTCSHEQLILDEEISAMARRISAGLEVTEETIALDLIRQIGPCGEYLTADHTLARLRSAEYLAPRVSVRGPFATWQRNGAKDSYALARARAKGLGRANGDPLCPGRAAKLAEIIANMGRSA